MYFDMVFLAKGRRLPRLIAFGIGCDAGLKLRENGLYKEGNRLTVPR